MKSHAKASSAGSNSGQGASLESLHRPGPLALLALVLAVGACLIPGSAFAGETRLPLESFGSEGTLGSEKFEYPRALAFDQGNKRIYAFDAFASKVYGFDASTPGTYTPLGGNFPLAVEAGGTESPDLAVDNSSHRFYYLSPETATLYGFDAAGNALGGSFPIGGFDFPCGAGVDASGDIWIGDYITQTINEYDSAGNPIDTIDTSAQGRPCHVALDSEANLYVSFYLGTTWRYSAASNYAAATKIDPVAGSFPFPVSPITVDRSSDDLYVAHPSYVSVYDSSGAFLYNFGDDVSGAQYGGIAIDQAGDRAYLADVGNGLVQVFGSPVLLPSVTIEDVSAVGASTATLNGTVDPEGKQLTNCHFEYGTTTAYGQSAPCVPSAGSIPADSSAHAVSANISGLGPNTTYHVRLVAATAEGTANGSDLLFTTAIGPPVVSSQSVEAVGTSDATLSAKVNPNGAKTTYHVEYGTSAAYGSSTPESAPIGFGADNSDHNVSVHIGGLNPGIAYHFRFVATSPAGSAQGSDATFATYSSASIFEPCPNDGFRTSFGARLSDCRAYEQATPVDKHGANIQGSINLIQAASGGNRISFLSNGGLPTSGGGSTFAPYIASRGASGWSFDGLLPATDPGLYASVLGWSDDLATSLAIGPGLGNVGEALYLRDSDSAAFQAGLAPGFIGEPFLAGFAADTSHLIFETNAALAPGAVSGFEYNLYDLDHGTVTLPGRIPAGSATSCDDAGGPACIPAPAGAFAGPYAWQAEFNPTANGGAKGSGAGPYYTQNTISRDGSRVFFTTRNSAQLYVREDATRTTKVSASQRTVPDPNGEKPAAFMAATPDGSKVFFASCEKLTDDSTAVSDGENFCTHKFANQGQDLYSYDVDSGELTDLTVDPNVSDPKGAAVQGVLGTSDDGSYVYFAAAGVLAPGASSGSCQGFGAGQTCNLYVSHNGAVAFIATLTEGTDSGDWRAQINGLAQRNSRVSADGRTLLFGSERSLTGYDNAASVSTASMSNVCGAAGHVGEPCSEFFHYNAPSKELTCVSCNPTGVPPTASASLGPYTELQATGLRSTFLTRNLSADGNRAFFESKDALLPTDTNGVSDAYEWEADGSGSCHSKSQGGGCLYLLSSGTSPDPSHFADASLNGDHAFIFSDQQLVPSDHDELVDIYDAGVGAGLASQHVLAPPTCTGVACQANAAPPPDQAAASAVFSGPGNAHQRSSARKCPKGKRKVRRAGKVSCQKAHKQHKRHSNRGGSK